MQSREDLLLEGQNDLKRFTLSAALPSCGASLEQIRTSFAFSHSANNAL
jgi:hypothetical protein